MTEPLGFEAPQPQLKPIRALWEREPVRVINAAFTFIAAVNAVLLGAGVYSGAVAGIITGIIAALAALTNELFTRAEVVPLRPLEDLAAAQENHGPPAGLPGPAPGT
jgi:energy-converting hydrogenase Eha subunit A